jgi:uncharacterized surface protein with fasciclin (FAS1) repeats
MKRIFLYILPLFIVFGCKNTDLTIPASPTDNLRNMGDFINNNYDFSMLTAALKKTNLLDSLNAVGPFTIWAPDNAAFASAGYYSPLRFDSVNVDSLRYALKYLILPSRTYISNLPTQLDLKYKNLNGDSSVQYISVLAQGTNGDAYPVTIDGCSVNSAPQRNIGLQNGVVHVLSRMPQNWGGTIQSRIARDTSFSIFEALMKKANLWDSLALPGPYTAYAPDNNAFRKYGMDADSIARIDMSRYNPLAFNVYVLGLQPHHLFMSDFSMVGGYGAALTLGLNYTLAPNLPTGIFIRYTANGSATFTPGFINIVGGYAGEDNLTNNGIFNHIDNLIFYPDSLLIK